MRLLFQIIVILIPLSSFALPKGKGIEFFADDLQYNEKIDVITARGKVEAVQEVVPCPLKERKCFRIIKADKVIYNRKKDRIRAIGNVSLMTEDGNVAFADKIGITGDLKKGLIENFKMEFKEGGHFKAKKALRNEPETKLTDASFTTCKECEDGSSLWKIKAGEVTYNKEKQEISYKHALLETYGVPIFYTPYFFHPSPDADRKTGLLAPSFKQDSDLGFQFTTPYYLNLDENYDATIYPTITTKEGLVLAGEFRHKLNSGYYQFFGSGTFPQEEDTHDFRGHIEGIGNFNISDNWNWGFYGKRASDDTYLYRYDFGNEDTLTSSLFTNYISDNSFFNARTIAFQGLRPTDDADTIPFVLPSMDYNYQSDPLFLNSQFILNGNFVSLFRDEGNDIGRGVAEGGWKLPAIIGGSRLELSLWVRGDIYRIEDEFGNEEYEERVIPTAYLGWRHPLIRRGKSSTIIIEPIAEFIASPDDLNEDIPNEDSQVPDFSIDNLFTRNRYDGYDLVESGLRVNYGVRTRAKLGDNHNISGVIGQVYREGDEYFAGGGDEDFSYIVGETGYSYNDNLSFNFKFKLDEEDLSLKTGEVNSLLDTSPIQIELDYITIQDDMFIQDIEEIYLSGLWKITDNWRIGGYGKRDLQNEGMLESGALIGFENECIDIFVNYKREFTSYLDADSGSSVSLNLKLKGLN